MMNLRAITGGTVFTPSRIIAEGVVLINGDRIVAVGAPDEVTLPAGTPRICAQGAIVCPGLVDLHVHGGAGADCADGTPGAVRTVARRHLQAGTTSLLATTSSAPLPSIWQAFAAIRAVMSDRQPDEARLLGIHMEGPFFSIAQRGAHAAHLLRMPTPAEREVLRSHVPDLKRLSIAPEREGALDIIAEMSRLGVLVSGAHSDAFYGQVCQAMEAGMTHITHLWSGMSTVRRIGPKRHSGMIEAALLEDGLTGEMIADGYHLPSSLMKMAYCLKGPEKLCLVSDAMAGSGGPPGIYEIAGVRGLVEPGSGVAITEDRTAFAGSISTMLQCLQQIVHVVGLSLLDGLRMATETPARILGVQDQVGRLAPGCYADVLLLDPATLALRQVLLEGRARF
jgi:N-acetylglucosamine-6-phosphate deacetylase